LFIKKVNEVVISDLLAENEKLVAKVGELQKAISTPQLPIIHTTKRRRLHRDVTRLAYFTRSCSAPH
jgi:hypothetical protein